MRTQTRVHRQKNACRQRHQQRLIRVAIAP
jgi:hypothetical protein